MKDLGFNVVRIGELAWRRLEPREDEYDFLWFDEVIDLLGKNGIYSVVYTPTACPRFGL